MEGPTSQLAKEQTCILKRTGRVRCVLDDPLPELRRPVCRRTLRLTPMPLLLQRIETGRARTAVHARECRCQTTGSESLDLCSYLCCVNRNFLRSVSAQYHRKIMKFRNSQNIQFNSARFTYSVFINRAIDRQTLTIGQHVWNREAELSGCQINDPIPCSYYAVHGCSKGSA